ncbi:MAG: hypothetical protein ACYSWU_17435 [Planctomycetota bacterium]|jgi:hypothetical protein
MGFRPGIGSGFWPTLAITALLVPGCLVAPFGGYHTPDTIGEGNTQVGVAGAVISGVESDDGFTYVMSEADVWLDFGVARQIDLRARAFLLKMFPSGSGVDLWAPGLSLESKFSNRSGTAALITGLSAEVMIEVGQDPFLLVTPWIGGSFGIGRPGGLRLLLSPRVAAGLGSLGVQKGGAASFSIGLDIPVVGNICIRPEATVNCSLLVRKQFLNNWNPVYDPKYEEIGFFHCWAGLGTAVVF